MQSKKFKIVAAKNLSKEQMAIIEQRLPAWIEFFEEHGWKCRKDSSAHFRRGIMGYSPPELYDVGLTFKRLSKRRLLFGFVRIEDLEFREPFKKGCMCAIHMGGQKATLKNLHTIDNDFVVLYEGGGAWDEAKISG